MNIEECGGNTRRERAGARIPKLCLTHIADSYLNYARIEQNHSTLNKEKNV